MRILSLATALLWPSLLVAQAPPADLTRERAAHTQWLSTDPLSPARASSFTPIDADGITLGGAAADVEFPGAPTATVSDRDGRIVLRGWGDDRNLTRHRATPLRGHRLVPVGTPGRSSLLIYRDDKPGKRPTWYPYQRAAALVVSLNTTTPRPQRVLSPEGTTVEATELGTVQVTFADTTLSLKVMRFPVDAEESRILINFRDGTNDAGTYPAGRFVELIPAGGDRYRLDFNRAFNPHCAYSSVFPCPIPWGGNAFTARVEAGEKYPAEAVTP
jgi:hypothetical protein